MTNGVAMVLPIKSLGASMWLSLRTTHASEVLIWADTMNATMDRFRYATAARGLEPRLPIRKSPEAMAVTTSGPLLKRH
jgi:hypothetical protein